MGRYTGPVEKLERREGVSLDLKGKRQPWARPRWSGEGRCRPASTAPRGGGRRASTANSCARRQKLKIAYDDHSDALLEMARALGDRPGR